MIENLYFENRHEDCIGNEHKFTLYVAWKDDSQLRVIGFIQYTLLNEELFVDFVEVKEELRGMGIGKELYRRLYNLNKNCLFQPSGYLTKQGHRIRTWFDKEILRGEVS